MVDITQPSILGYAITPWFIMFCLFIIGTIISAILVITGFTKRALNEQKIIEKTIINTSALSAAYKQVSDLSQPAGGSNGMNAASYEETEVINSGEEQASCEDTEVLEDENEGNSQETEVLESEPEQDNMDTEVLEVR